MTTPWPPPNDTPYLLLLLLGSLLRRQQGFVVGAALSSEVDLGERVLHQQDGQVGAIDMQPADEVAGLVHALHFHLYLGDRERGCQPAGGGPGCAGEESSSGVQCSQALGSHHQVRSAWQEQLELAEGRGCAKQKSRSL